MKTSPPSPFVKTNLKTRFFSDIYHWLLVAQWWQILMGFALIFVGINAIFGAIYMSIGGIANISNDQFWESFFFSVHTLATVGYGNMYPTALLAQLVVMIEIMTGMLMMGIITGIIFAKFSRPTVKVIFSKVALINSRNGKPSLTFRLANGRGTHIAEAQINVSILKNEVTTEGENMRKLHTLTLERSQTPLFIISWTILHSMDEQSPIFGLSHEDFVEGDIRIIISLTGYDPVIGQTVHARHQYHAKDIHFGQKFKDSLFQTGQNELHFNIDLFHETE